MPTETSTKTRCAGVDLSLTSTGVTLIGADNSITTGRVRSKGSNNDPLELRHTRLSDLAWQVVQLVTSHGTPSLVVIEAPALSRVGGHNHDRSGLWWLVVSMLLGVTTVVDAPPSVRAKYAAGKGNAGKDEVLAAVIRRYPQANITCNDEADALALAALGARAMGEPIEASLPKACIDACDTWASALSPGLLAGALAT